MNTLSQNAIARTAHISKHSVQDVLEAARGRGVSWEGASLGGGRRGDVRGGRLRAAVPRQGRRRAGTRRPRLGTRPPRAREDRRHAQAPARGVRRRVRGAGDVDVLRQVLQAINNAPPGSTGARPTYGSVAHRPVTIKKHRGQCRPRCPSAISAVPFRDIRQCSSEQILIPLKNSRRLSLDKCRYARLFGFV